MQACLRMTLRKTCTSSRPLVEGMIHALEAKQLGMPASSGRDTICFPFSLSPVPQRKPAIKVIPLSVLAQLQIQAVDQTHLTLLIYLVYL